MTHSISVRTLHEVHTDEAFLGGHRAWKTGKPPVPPDEWTANSQAWWSHGYLAAMRNNNKGNLDYLNKLATNG